MYVISLRYLYSYCVVTLTVLLILLIAAAVSRYQNKLLSHHDRQQCTPKPLSLMKTMKTLPAEGATISRRLSRENTSTTTSRRTEMLLLFVVDVSCRYIFLRSVSNVIV